MTARDLLHHVFPWEVTTGVERLDAKESEGLEVLQPVLEAVLEPVLEAGTEAA